MCRLFVESDPAMWVCDERSLRIDRMVTSVRLEVFYWDLLDQIAKRDGMTVTGLITKLYHEAIEAGHNLGNFNGFLRVCCGRYLTLQLSGDIPQDKQVPIRSLDAEKILQNERADSIQRHLHVVK